jgi:hypothetical protein
MAESGASSKALAHVAAQDHDRSVPAHALNVGFRNALGRSGDRDKARAQGMAGKRAVDVGRGGRALHQPRQVVGVDPVRREPGPETARANGRRLPNERMIGLPLKLRRRSPAFLRSLLALTFIACGLVSAAPAFAANPHTDRRGMFCIDVNALSARLQSVKDGYDSIFPTDTAQLLFRVEKARRHLWRC